MKVVTAGARYMDIDAYGGCAAYVELLRLKGEEASFVSTAPLNESITPTIQKWDVKIERKYDQAQDDEFVLIDVSDPDAFDPIVDQTRIDTILDYHVEHTKYWRQKIGDKAIIEFIGAACTLVYEEWKRAGKIADISETSARLLIAGILDNTLNFKAQITTDRDHAAYRDLSKYAHLPENWSTQYFLECQQLIRSNLKKAILNDIKIVQFPSIRQKVTTGQLVVWNANAIVAEHQDEIQSTMDSEDDRWIMNIVSLAEDRNYLLASNPEMRDFLEGLLNVAFMDSVAVTARLWLRKEIIKQDMDRPK